MFGFSNATGIALGLLLFRLVEAQDTPADGKFDQVGCPSFEAFDITEQAAVTYSSLNGGDLKATANTCVDRVTDIEVNSLTCLYLKRDASSPESTIFGCSYPSTNGVIKQGTRATCKTTESSACLPWNDPPVEGSSTTTITHTSTILSNSTSTPTYTAPTTLSTPTSTIVIVTGAAAVINQVSPFLVLGALGLFWYP